MTDRASNAGNNAMSKPAWHHMNASPATRQATSRQRRRALWTCVGIVSGTLLLLPLAAVMGPRVPAFLPSYQTATVVAYVIITYLIFAHYRATRALDLLFVGGACFYCAGIFLLQFLALPDMFLPHGSLLGGEQTTIWLWFLWHAGLALGILAYAASNWRNPALMYRHSQRLAHWLMAAVAAALLASMALVTVFHAYLPRLDDNGDFRRLASSGAGPLLQCMTGLAFLVLWQATRFRAVLHVWLGVALVALLCDNAITMAGGSQFSVGWYVGRCNALASATLLLLIYLREMNQVYLKTVQDARLLALNNAMLEVRMDQVRLDDLTGLPSRSLFLELAETLRSRDLASRQAVALLFIDLDGFKRVNDDLGHDRGDTVLVEVAAALRSVLRDSDIAGRVGGDEFVVCLVAPAAAVKATATAVAGRIVSRVAAIGDGIGCSIGIALCQAENLEWDAALRQADAAMYQAKRQGKSRFTVYGHALLDEIA
ncbi:diguanylate cyclase [Collimonas sp. OK412]|jgi:diguanylate cyclase (GGDEF)-like protein|uniref:GGDEF domain-containing protein n=1 Tax=Collimonas sp. (strain OK412) TaxID=1801619 RepID=UPI0008E60924|nr:sensor domain-containing diguanylate cyclase [Collimonas sp. OK412]SFD06521.1 diguanylate cyclase (GGDEF) domain-containing protein [Collimonas sp. OK412]